MDKEDIIVKNVVIEEINKTYLVWIFNILNMNPIIKPTIIIWKILIFIPILP